VYDVRMLKYRLIFGPLMIAVLLGVVVLDGVLDQVDLTGTPFQDLFLGRTYLPAGLLMLLCFAVLVVLGSKEMCLIFRAKGVVIDTPVIILSSLLGLVLFYAIPHGLASQTAVAIYGTSMAGLFLATLIIHSRRGRTQGAIHAAAAGMFTFVYLGVLPGYLMAIRSWHSAWILIAIIGITKACDIGAYFTGRALGKHKLIPWLSPGKTWEGLIGGMLLSALLAAGLAAIGNHCESTGYWLREGGIREFKYVPYPLWFVIPAGLLIGLIGQFGDLVASLFKRDAGIKDSGRAIPGFGGVLDVVDSPIVVAPFAYWLLMLTRYL
jgi:phosphatidate cytidylyltransferase